MIGWLKSWLGRSGDSPPSTPQGALLARQASYPRLIAPGHGQDLGQTLLADLEPKIPAILRSLFASGRAVIGEVGICSPAAFANALPSGGYWVEVYSGLGPFFEAAARALYASVNVVDADGTVATPQTGIDESDTELEKILRAYAASGEVLETKARASARQLEIAGRLARAAQVFVVAHELGHLMKWETEESREFTAQGETAADKLGLSILLGMLKQDSSPLPDDDITDAYAGAEFALRLFSALDALEFDFKADKLHPHPKDRLGTLRRQARGIFGITDFIYVSRRAFSHDLMLQRMEESVAGRRRQGIPITSAIQGVANLASWIAATAKTGSLGPEKAAGQFEAIYEKTTAEMRAEIAREFAKAYTNDPIAGGDSTVRAWRREKEALASVLPHLSVNCRKWIDEAFANAVAEKTARQDAATGTPRPLIFRCTSDFSDKASAVAGSPLEYEPTQEAINVLKRPAAPAWVEGTPDLSEETRRADGLIQIPSQFAFCANLEKHAAECACGCQGGEVATFMLKKEQPTVVRQMQVRNMVWAAAGGDEDQVLRYLKAGVDIDSDHDGGTALIYAAQQGQVRMVELLLNRGASIRKKAPDGRSAIFFAARRGNSEVVKLLLDRGQEADVRDDEGRTPLMYAAANGHSESVKLLLKRGASSGL